ncbi:acyl-CoA thioesterase [Salinarchaeum sp. IM2453]|uniref:acyl-CoA thioesterase n=1 Tax=Salinarchaeum sp. IM2453 TaxID=2862870 RepID=UPI001C83E34C|nr:thioesterase family protein [Salinarchaeum sp. IM2453]QZA88121.1 acyl-CoA thioesterase [Salinarchaeum sp. IM2453]
MDSFDYTTEIQVRFRDLDTLGHVNNAVYVTYLEQARVAFLEEVVGITPADAGIVVASLSVDYEQPVTTENTITVGLTVPMEEVGEHSFALRYEVFTEDNSRVATAESVQVAYDSENQTPRQIPEEWLNAVVAYRETSQNTT